MHVNNDAQRRVYVYMLTSAKCMTHVFFPLDRILRDAAQAPRTRGTAGTAHTGHESGPRTREVSGEPQRDEYGQIRDKWRRVAASEDE